MTAGTGQRPYRSRLGRGKAGAAEAERRFGKRTTDPEAKPEPDDTNAGTREAARRFGQRNDAA